MGGSVSSVGGSDSGSSVVGKGSAFGLGSLASDSGFASVFGGGVGPASGIALISGSAVGGDVKSSASAAIEAMASSAAADSPADSGLGDAFATRAPKPVVVA